MRLLKLHNTTELYRCLNGIVNIYKPAGVKLQHVKSALLYNVCKDLNHINSSKIKVRCDESVICAPGDNCSVLDKITQFSDHRLAVGFTYQIKDIRCLPLTGLGIHTSGVLLFGINKGIKDVYKLKQNRTIRTYHATGCLGKATETHFSDSVVTVKEKYHHVHPEKISALASSMQASHQRKMFEYLGVDIQSEAAYEIACQGPIRIAGNTQPMLYGIKLIDFQRPFFTLEIHTINESEKYIAALIHEMGITLRTVAHCHSIRCIRHGNFGMENALLRHKWNLLDILQNIRHVRETIDKLPHCSLQK